MRGALAATFKSKVSKHRILLCYLKMSKYNMFKKIIAHILFYILSVTVLYFSHKLVPTNLAGPGLEMLVLLLLIFIIPYLVISSWLNHSITFYSKVYISITHFVGICIILWWLSLPS
jgi:hypothetical protein